MVFSFCKSLRKGQNTCCLVKPSQWENHLPFGCMPKEEVSCVTWRFKTCTGNSLSQLLGVLHSLVLRNNRERYHDDPWVHLPGASSKHLSCQLFDFTASISSSPAPHLSLRPFCSAHEPCKTLLTTTPRPVSKPPTTKPGAVMIRKVSLDQKMLDNFLYVLIS